MVKNLLDSDKILVVLEVANNHQGDVDHANALLENYHHVLKIIEKIWILRLSFNIEIYQPLYIRIMSIQKSKC